jgi:hypothetical protein
MFFKLDLIGIKTTIDYVLILNFIQNNQPDI